MTLPFFNLLSSAGLLAQAGGKIDVNTLHGAVPGLPPDASTVAGNVDWILYFVTGITVFFTVLIFALMIYFVVRYRHTKGRKPEPSAGHSTALELTWTIIPTILVVVIFFYGFREYLNMIVVPPNTYEIRAHGYTWGWTFFYPNGAVDNNLHVPANRPVRIILTSEDVIHALYIPALRLQKSNVPGRYNKMWFEAKFVNKEEAEKPHTDAEGKPVAYTEEHQIFCNQYCGQSHSEMLAKLVVHRPEDYAAFVTGLADWRGKKKPSEQGQAFWSQRGCSQCHTLDGSKGTGPSWKDLWGRKATYDGGKAYTADDDYIRESILYPDRHIVDGYSNQMPSYKGQLKDYDIDAIIAYMKTISSHWDGGDPNGTTPAPGGNTPAPAAGGATGGAAPDSKK
jgi:cytochrome c oxidase subunit 2